MQTNSIVYPAGARVRVAEICKNSKTGRPGLLPINRATWYKWLKAGLVPPGETIGGCTTVWPVEVVLNLGRQAPAGDDPSSERDPAAPGSAVAAPVPAGRSGPRRGPVRNVARAAEAVPA